MVVAAGKSFETKTPASIFVSDPVEESAGLPETSAPEIQALSFERMNFTDLTGVNVMSFDQDRPNTLYTVTISDSAGHSVIRRGMGAVSFFWDDLSSFTSGDSVRVRVTARDSVSRGSVDAYTASKMVFDQNMTLADSYAPKNEIGFDVRVRNGSEIEIVGTTPADERILATEMYIIQPDGSVQVRSFDSLIADPNDSAILKKNTPVAYSFDAPEDGVYLVEVNYDTGFAAVNVPIVIGNSSLPLAANVIDQMREEDYASIDEVDRASLEFLNALRARYGLGKLRLSDKLDRLAQIKADDMAANSYVGHVDSEGVYIDGTAKRHDISLTKSLSENVAGGNVGYGILNSALSLSGGHRAN
ncbi:MAG TPA: CAP domain-containing protein, partial [bacterium]|nr:CAP domain-containing protein [bacterium]